MYRVGSTYLDNWRSRNRTVNDWIEQGCLGSSKSQENQCKLVCSKSFNLGFSSTLIQDFWMYKLHWEKAEETEIKLHSLDHGESKETPGGKKKKKNTFTSASLTMLKPLSVWITTNCGKFLKRWEYLITLPVPWETYMWVKKQQLEPYTEQKTDSKLGKEYDKAVYCHPVYLTYIQSTSCKMLGWMNPKLESRLPREISTTSAMQVIPRLTAESYEELNSL